MAAAGASVVVVGSGQQAMDVTQQLLLSQAPHALTLVYQEVR
jgi:cation diffusion facilitator CzcD-associated flavoprotein CzcO